MGPRVDFETGRKTKFLITHGHKRDHGIFYEAGRSRMQKISTQTPSQVVTTRAPQPFPAFPQDPAALAAAPSGTQPRSGDIPPPAQSSKRAVRKML